MKAAAVNIEDLRRLARKRLPRMLFDFLDGGSGDEVSLRGNRSDFEKIRFIPRILVDVSKRSLATTLFGVPQRLPLVLAPVGSSGLLSRRGEVRAARAAERCGVPYCLSTASLCPIEDVRAARSEPFWFQLYVGRDRELARGLVERARVAGCNVLVFTVDAASTSRRDRDLRNGLTFPPRITPRNAWEGLRRLPWIYDVMLKGPPMNMGNYSRYETPGSRPLTFPERAARTQDPSKTWEDARWVRSLWKGPLVIKGIMTPEDGRRAVDHGADGIVVSNHGAVLLDGAASTISVLPKIAEEVRGRATVLFDGGIRRGHDALKALALGADACLIGRAFAYGLAAMGEAGVERALAILEQEMMSTLALLGKNGVAELDRSVLRLD